MLNASYNLPSEDCNTEKQMVFHSNKLLCVYSLQSWLSDTFTFGSELPCCWQTGGDGASLGRGFLRWGGHSQPPTPTPGVQLGFRLEHREVLCPRHSWYLQFRQGVGSRGQEELAAF